MGDLPPDHYPLNPLCFKNSLLDIPGTQIQHPMIMWCHCKNFWHRRKIPWAGWWWTTTTTWVGDPRRQFWAVNILAQNWLPLVGLRKGAGQVVSQVGDHDILAINAKEYNMLISVFCQGGMGKRMVRLVPGGGKRKKRWSTPTQVLNSNSALSIADRRLAD